MLVIRDARADELDEIADLIAAAYAQFGPAPGSPKELVDAFDEYRVDQDHWAEGYVAASV